MLDTPVSNVLPPGQQLRDSFQEFTSLRVPYLNTGLGQYPGHTSRTAEGERIERVVVQTRSLIRLLPPEEIDHRTLNHCPTHLTVRFTNGALQWCDAILPVGNVGE